MHTTPPILSKMLCSFRTKRDRMCVDLMCGDGAFALELCKFYRVVYAIDKDNDRLDILRSKIADLHIDNIRVVHLDLFSMKCYKDLIIPLLHCVDAVYLNPDFKFANRALTLASWLIKHDGFIFAVLPSNFWHANSRKKLYFKAPWRVLQEFHTGTHNYNSDFATNKRSSDSIYVLTQRTGSRRQDLCWSWHDLDLKRKTFGKFINGRKFPFLIWK